MSDYGQCSEPLCTCLSVRLFDCIHHCMKPLCLQHLIEHDQLIDHNQEHVTIFRTELKELWTVYSLLVDENKLHLEYERKLEKHRQLVQDITNLPEYNPVNIEQYRLVLEKLKQNIEQLNQCPSESLPNTEQIKVEPCDHISITNETDSSDVSSATDIERSNSEITQQDEEEQQQQEEQSTVDDSIATGDYDQLVYDTLQRNNRPSIGQKKKYSPSLRKSSGKCPFWLDGAYGLTQKSHGIPLCPRNKYYRQLNRHFIRFHKLKLPIARKVYRAIVFKKNFGKKILFQPNDVVIDRKNQLQCPFSIHNKTSSMTPDASQRHCRSIKLQLTGTLRCHLIRYHHMKRFNANNLIWKLKKRLKEAKD